MGSSTHYLAIPTDSSLYTALQTDLAFNTIMIELLPYSGDLYTFFSTIDKEEREDIIDDILIRNQPVLGENPQAKIDAFFAEIDRTRENYPGIEHRIAMLEKCDTDIESRLIAALTKEESLAQKYDNVPELVKKMIRGDGVLHPDLSHVDVPQVDRVRKSWEDILGLTSAPIVKQGAAILSLLSPRLLFPTNQDPDTWQRENYIKWRKVYIAAAKNKEALLSGFS